MRNDGGIRCKGEGKVVEAFGRGKKHFKEWKVGGPHALRKGTIAPTCH